MGLGILGAPAGRGQVIEIEEALSRSSRPCSHDAPKIQGNPCQGLGFRVTNFATCSRACGRQGRRRREGGAVGHAKAC